MAAWPATPPADAPQAGQGRRAASALRRLWDWLTEPPPERPRADLRPWIIAAAGTGAVAVVLGLAALGALVLWYPVGQWVGVRGLARAGDWAAAHLPAGRAVVAGGLFVSAVALARFGRLLLLRAAQAAVVLGAGILAWHVLRGGR
jgi:hypothetical protein